jgi:hypothetical protein
MGVFTMLHKQRAVCLATSCLIFSALLLNSHIAVCDETAALDSTFRMFNPDAYTKIPAGRDGKTIGLAVVPKLTDKSDDAERAIAELVGHIPGINMVITLPKNDPLYLHKFLKHLKASDRSVDLLFICGHALQKIENDVVFGINMGDGIAMVPASFNPTELEKEIDELTKSGKDAQRKRELCDKLKLIKEGSSALIPGAQFIVHSCYFGSNDAKAAMTSLATAFLGVNGGKAIGPNQPIGSKILGGDNAPDGVVSAIKQTLVTRSVQLVQSIKSKKLLRPGDAFISTNQYWEYAIPAGILRTLANCEPVQGWKCSTPQIDKREYGGTANVQATFIEFSWKYGDEMFKQRLDIVPPPEVINPGDKVRVQLSCPPKIVYRDGSSEGIDASFFTNDSHMLVGSPVGSKVKNLDLGGVSPRTGTTTGWWEVELKKDADRKMPFEIRLSSGARGADVNLTWTFRFSAN